jgi:hypothetical protein
MKALKANVRLTGRALFAVAIAWAALWGGRVEGGVVFPEVEGQADMESRSTYYQRPPERRGMMLDALQLRMSMPGFYGGRETALPPPEWRMRATPPPAPSP